MKAENVPDKAYGILQQHHAESVVDEAVEQVRNLGFAVLDAGYTLSEINGISDEFNRTHERYVKMYGESKLRSVNEFHTVRSTLTHGGSEFLKLALNENLLSILRKLIQGKFILNQQNGIINPSQERYNQGAWHRDLPYQHFISSRPLAINALYCLDDFTVDNGATFVLSASHKCEEYPSQGYIKKNAIQVEAKAGSFILLDCMLFHAGGFNKTDKVRRAVNHVYNIPYFKQQINIPLNMQHVNLSDDEKSILGFSYIEPTSVADYILAKTGEKY